MIYTKKQLQLMRLWQTNQLKRINILEGSVSSGKTWISLVLWAFWVKTMPEENLYMMCAKSLTALKRNCLFPLTELVGESNFSFSMARKEGILFGRKILLEGANDARAESKIRGLTLQGAYCDELSQFPKDFFTMLLSRNRKSQATIFATTNPDSPSHWLKTDYIDRADELSLLDIKFTLDDNTTLDSEYVRNIKLEYTGIFYERFILGKWVLAEGLIYPMYQNVLEKPPENVPDLWALSIDYGTQNAFAGLLWGHFNGVWYAVDGYYHSGRDTNIQKTDDEYGKDLEKFVKKYTDRKIPVVIDPSASSFIALLRKTKWASVRKADNAVLDGIRETATAMQKGLIKVNPAIKEWKKEVEGYVWDDKSIEEKPVKVNDHYMDSTRYFVKTFGIAKPKTTYKAVW
ncbi:MAG: PBSX family phage terminase large subunit [Ruminococcus sp.]|nr:PBSX family phage terminase large subunit [Ruminococcus sp.]